MKTKHFYELVLRTFKKEDITEEDAVNFLMRKVAESSIRGTCFGIYIGIIMAWITILIIGPC